MRNDAHRAGDATHTAAAEHFLERRNDTICGLGCSLRSAGTVKYFARGQRPRA